MFGWRRRSEGFEWREHVRTTVLVRRADRQRRLDDARQVALAKVHDSRERIIHAGRSSVETLLGALGAALRGLWDVIVAVALATGAMLMRSLMKGVQLLRATLAQLLTRLPALPQFKVSLGNQRMPAVRLPFTGSQIGLAGLALAAIFGIGPMLRGGGEGGDGTNRVLGSASPAVTLAATTSQDTVGATITGRATAASGDTLRLNGALIKLAGITAPANGHPCQKSNGRRWSCSAAAQKALNRLVRSDAVACTVTGRDAAGNATATCARDGMDLAAELARDGHVFADATYSQHEATARDAKRGLWQGGDVVRPDEWRQRIWQAAAQTAPQGCPIKGLVRASARVYALPGSNDYDSARVRETRGDRWFCSEEEARSAGFKLSGQS